MKTKFTQAFSLIETAIVLGVIGLIIGGIWVAAASVSRAHRANEITNTMSLIYNNIKNLHAQNRPSASYFPQEQLMASLAPGYKTVDGGIGYGVEVGPYSIFPNIYPTFMWLTLQWNGGANAECSYLANVLTARFRYLSPTGDDLAQSANNWFIQGEGDQDFSTMDAITANCPNTLNGIMVMLAY